MFAVFLTLYTPMPENIRGVSAHPYFLLKYRPADVKVKVYTYNLNSIVDEDIEKVEKELNLEIIVLKRRKWYDWILRYRLTFIRIFLKQVLECYIRPTKKEIEQIKKDNPDVIWRYSYQLNTLGYELPLIKQIVSDPDCPALTLQRQLALPSSHSSIIKFMALAKLSYTYYYTSTLDYYDNVLHHFVGLDDMLLQKKINPKKNSFFLRHPHYKIIDKPQISFEKDVLDFLVAGSYDMYMKDGAEELIEGLKLVDKNKRKHIKITFLGKNWGTIKHRIESIGITVVETRWVDDYVESISKFDVQIAPISLGSGTKGKVLDGFANGLLVIGTPIALENIEVKHKESCLCYNTASELSDCINYVISNRDDSLRLASNGMQKVREYHSPKQVSNEFWGIVKNFCNK